MRKNLALVAAGLFAGIAGTAWVDNLTSIHSFRSMVSIACIDATSTVARIRDGKSDLVIKDFDRTLDGRIVLCDTIFDGAERLDCLWTIKDYVMSNSIAISASNKLLLDNLPVCPLTSCEASGKCPIRPSAKVKEK